ncbi:hypothetical protein D3C87_12930 [compost metagenome]
MKTVIYLTICLFLFLINSCSKSPKCWGKDKNKGDISANMEIRCEPISGDQWIIQDENTYQQTFPAGCSLPSIDFSKYTLLGVSANGGCETKYIREVTRSDNGNVDYVVTVKSCGTCKSLALSNNWVTIPKIPSTATVHFDVKSK